MTSSRTVSHTISIASKSLPNRKGISTRRMCLHINKCSNHRITGKACTMMPPLNHFSNPITCTTKATEGCRSNTKEASNILDNHFNRTNNTESHHLLRIFLLDQVAPRRRDQEEM